MKAILLVLLFSGFGSAFAAENHGIGRINSGDLELTYIDHVLTGRIGDRPVFARPLEDEFGLYLWHRAAEKNFETKLIKTSAGIVGAVKSIDPKGNEIDTEFRIAEINAQTGIINGDIGDRRFSVLITSETMEENHYINPTFDIEFSDGAAFKFTLEGSQACMGCAIKLSYAIIAMLYTYGVI